jgi:hypothetical protein
LDQILQLVLEAYTAFNQLIIDKELPKSLFYKSWDKEQQELLQNSKSQSKLILQKRKQIFHTRNLDTSANKPSIEHIQRMLESSQNYVNKPFYENFLRIDVMYWYDEKRFYVNEVETWACGKLSDTYNTGIHALLYKYLLESDYQIQESFYNFNL